MRDFFKYQLEHLHLTTGFQQYAKLSQESGGIEKFTFLLDELEGVCKRFPYIPDEEKKTIIKDSMISDPDFMGFNPKIIWKWMNANANRFFKQEAHQPTELGEPAPPEVAEKYINEFYESMKHIGDPPIVNGMKELRKEKGFSESITRTASIQTDREKVLIHTLKNNWIAENFFEDGSRRPGFMTWDEWYLAFQQKDK